MQTLEAIPLEGERSRRRNSFVLTGQSDTARAHATRLAERQDQGLGAVVGAARRCGAERVLAAMEASFRAIDGVLPTASAPSPRRGAAVTCLREWNCDGRSARGRAFSSMTRARWRRPPKPCRAAVGSPSIPPMTPGPLRGRGGGHRDPVAGRAAGAPGFARFSPDGARLDAVVRVAGFSYAETLTRPVLTRGRSPTWPG
jgi:hypothetical protein